MGDREGFAANARKLIDRIKATGAKELVTPCAGCYKTFAKLYPEIGRSGAQTIYHSVHYLEKLINDGRIKLKGDLGKKVTYHDPCDLGRAL